MDSGREFFIIIRGPFGRVYRKIVDYLNCDKSTENRTNGDFYESPQEPLEIDMRTTMMLSDDRMVEQTLGAIIGPYPVKITPLNHEEGIASVDGEHLEEVLGKVRNHKDLSAEVLPGIISDPILLYNQGII